jgi:malonate-semialdehyde dehydrogenase (acetylating) / methylmalonate-semialdehyde dehydrogenase
MKNVGHWINSRIVHGHGAGQKRDLFNPSTGDTIGSVVMADDGDVDSCISSSSEAFHSWSQSSLSQRTKILFSFREILNRRVDELANVITEEHGKILSDARGEVQRGLEVVEFACGVPELLKGDYSDQVSEGVDLFSYRQPLGVVVGITPFNFPAMVPMWMFPVAIACGNTFILKPSERDPSASLLLADMWREAGLPDGVFNVLQGDATTVNALIDHPDVAAISFVGSTAIAKAIYERATMMGKRCQALGGAKNHAIVMPDADVDFAAKHLSAAAYGSAGERCMAISAAVTVGGIADAVVERVSELARAVRVGPGLDEASEMGPVITAAAKSRIETLIASGVEQGGVLRVDGRNRAPAGYENGFYVGPTILDHVTPSMDIYKEEVFGPVLSVVRAGSVDEAIDIINSNPYGNGTAIFTSSGATARRFHRDVTVGMIGVNVPIPVPMAYYSFGGWKDSLFGDRHMHGPEGISFYTRAKVVTARWPEVSGRTDASYSFPTAR